MPPPSELKSVFNYLDSHEEEFVSRLGEAVAIPSVSQEKAFRPQTVAIVEHFKALMEQQLSSSFSCRLHDLGTEDFPDGSKVGLPPVLLGELKAGESSEPKKTVCIYGHLDVQPALLSDGWSTEPFKLTEVDGKLFGRGSTDDKGPVLAWINCLQAFAKTETPLPVNLKVWRCGQVLMILLRRSNYSSVFIHFSSSLKRWKRPVRLASTSWSAR